MIAASARFVPAADEVWRLQRDDDPECRWFRDAVRGRPDPVAGSMQGTYVLTAGGRLLGRLNSNDPERVLAMLEQALQRWQQLPDAERTAPDPVDAHPRHRWEQSCPDDGLVLERFARDVAATPTEPPQQPVNRDAVWFAAAELHGFVPAAADDDDDDGQPTVGASRKVAPELVERLARFALVDNVRGQTLPFATAAVAVAQLRSEVIGADGARVTLRLTGRTAAATDGSEPGEDYWRSDRAWPRSVRTELLGEAVWDREQRRFVRFELVALGERTGRTTFNGRSREPQDTPRAIGFLLRLAPEGYRVAPTFVNLYGVSWIAMPAK